MKSYIKDLSLGVASGTTSQHLLCPACGGGLTKEKSFVITKEPTKVLYHCFRASCGLSGAIDQIRSTEIVTETTKKPLRPYTRETRPLSDKELDYCWNNWGLSESDLESQGVIADKTSGRLVFPLFTKEGWEWGHQLRAIDGSEPKASLFWHSEYKERVHFPKRKGTAGDTLILVEDIPSAIRIERHATHFVRFLSAGLLGTTLGHSVARSLSFSFKSVILALDEDATSKSIAYKKKYSLMFDKLEVVPLEKDVKNMNKEELDTFFSICERLVR